MTEASNNISKTLEDNEMKRLGILFKTTQYFGNYKTIIKWKECVGPTLYSTCKEAKNFIHAVNSLGENLEKTQ